MAATRLIPGSVYERLRPGVEYRAAAETDH
jgi:hypothetical protein